MSGFGNQDPFEGLRNYLYLQNQPPENIDRYKKSVEKELRKEFREKYTIRRPYILEAVVHRTVWPCMFLLGMIYAIISPAASVRMIKDGIEQYENDMGERNA